LGKIQLLQLESGGERSPSLILENSDTIRIGGTTGVCGGGAPVPRPFDLTAGGRKCGPRRGGTGAGVRGKKVRVKRHSGEQNDEFWEEGTLGETKQRKIKSKHCCTLFQRKAGGKREKKRKGSWFFLNWLITFFVR